MDRIGANDRSYVQYTEILQYVYVSPVISPILRVLKSIRPWVPPPVILWRTNFQGQLEGVLQLDDAAALSRSTLNFARGYRGNHLLPLVDQFFATV